MDKYTGFKIKPKFLYRFLIVLVLLLIGSFGYFNMSTNDGRVIAASHTLTQEWSEITISPPLKVYKQVQTIYLYFPEIFTWQIRDNIPMDKSWEEIVQMPHTPRPSIFMPNGKEVDIEIQLVSTTGKIYDLEAGSLIGDRGEFWGGMGFTYFKPTLDPPISRLPRNMKFNKLRLKATEKIETGPITWYCRSTH